MTVGYRSCRFSVPERESSRQNPAQSWESSRAIFYNEAHMTTRHETTKNLSLVATISSPGPEPRPEECKLTGARGAWLVTRTVVN
jgi:hypothetical protein